MTFRLVDNWRQVLQWAWSVRLMVLAGILSGLEVLIQVLVAYSYQPPIPPMLFAVLSGFVTMGALIARIVAQRGLSE